jgi:SAM-dependent methyltransferase
MRRVVYSPSLDRLVYLHEKATPQFWDALWVAEGAASPPTPRDPIVTVTRRYLPAGAKVLEGGCGRGNKVKALKDAGYAATGIDFAARTVAQARLAYPGVDVRQGDVRGLEFPDQFFDGYWSIGVIEHFWGGYDVILSEAARVLRPGGFLFLTAPWLSPYRQRLIRARSYRFEDFSAEPEPFYQFALGHSEVDQALARHGFRLLRWRGLASEVSMREDMPRLRSQVDWLLRSRGSIFKRVLRRIIVRAANAYCGHSFMAIAERQGTSSGVLAE